MPPIRTFSQYLIGQASFERPSFFYAYAGMWLHLLIGTILFLLFSTTSWLEGFAPLVISSFSFGIFIYGLLVREYILFINLGSYLCSLIRTLAPETIGFAFLLIAIITALVSAFFLLSSEYRRYNSEEYSEGSYKSAAVPIWIAVFMGIIVLLIFFYGLNLL
ncbi:MAG: hypothetical protein CME16_01455 [Gemmatimonadetes bacterium]|nr:hypothetical protein [Gemmatimonadota bacterium]